MPTRKNAIYFRCFFSQIVHTKFQLILINHIIQTSEMVQISWAFENMLNVFHKTIIRMEVMRENRILFPNNKNKTYCDWLKIANSFIRRTQTTERTNEHKSLLSRCLETCMSRGCVSIKFYGNFVH